LNCLSSFFTKLIRKQEDRKSVKNPKLKYIGIFIYISFILNLQGVLFIISSIHQSTRNKKKENELKFSSITLFVCLTVISIKNYCRLIFSLVDTSLIFFLKRPAYLQKKCNKFYRNFFLKSKNSKIKVPNLITINLINLRKKLKIQL